MSSQLSASEVTQAVTRYARRHNMYARTVRTMTSAKREAIVEWLEYKNDPRLALWLPSVTCTVEGCKARRTFYDELCATHLALAVEKIAATPVDSQLGEPARLRREVFSQVPSRNQCDGCVVGDAIENGLHVRRGTAYMTCQKYRYEGSLVGQSGTPIA